MSLHASFLAASVIAVASLWNGIADAGMSNTSSRTSVPSAVHEALEDMGMNGRIVSIEAWRTENFTRMNRPVRTYVKLRDAPGHVVFFTGPSGQLTGVYPMNGFDMHYLEDGTG